MSCPYCGAAMQRVGVIGDLLRRRSAWLCVTPTKREWVDLTTGQTGSCVASCGTTVAA